MEPWLRGNRRIVGWALAPVLALGLAAAVLVLLGLGGSGWLIAAGAVLLVLALASAMVLISLARTPRLAFDPHRRELVVQLGRHSPHRVPIASIECFLMGRGPSWLPARKHQRTETVTFVVRISERLEEFRHKEVEPMLGSWCDSHITIRGTWCEPLSVDLVMRLNQMLADAQQSHMPPAAGVTRR